MVVLCNAVLLSTAVVCKAEGNADAHSTRSSVRGTHALSRRRAHRRCEGGARVGEVDGRGRGKGEVVLVLVGRRQRHLLPQEIIRAPPRKDEGAAYVLSAEGARGVNLQEQCGSSPSEIESGKQRGKMHSGASRPAGEARSQHWLHLLAAKTIRALPTKDDRSTRRARPPSPTRRWGTRKINERGEWIPNSERLNPYAEAKPSERMRAKLEKKRPRERAEAREKQNRPKTSRWERCARGLAEKDTFPSWGY
ncbi:hypothetical protein K438DRAFT_776719 [Mycena galopus ATCC 62051]|nr:hypothetical protein K438DRAFT_776719 [Mycena galopus ATCC 62051]